MIHILMLLYYNILSIPLRIAILDPSLLEQSSSRHVGNGTADLYETIGFSTDVKGLPGLMKKINGWGDPGSRNRAGWCWVIDGDEWR